jgi:ABC-type multidrug transport system ATPase subunit
MPPFAPGHSWPYPPLHLTPSPPHSAAFSRISARKGHIARNRRRTSGFQFREGFTLEIRGLTKRYNGIPAVDNVSFGVEPGEILGYVGPNGAGKSTTVKMIVGLLEPSDGQVLYGGASIIEDMAAFQSRLGYVPEKPNLYPHLSGYEYLQLIGRLRGMRRKVLEAKIEEFLRLFSLWEDRFTPLSSYSKGMRQKIQLSAALMHNPDVLILCRGSTSPPPSCCVN